MTATVLPPPPARDTTPAPFAWPADELLADWREADRDTLPAPAPEAAE